MDFGNSVSLQNVHALLFYILAGSQVIEGRIHFINRWDKHIQLDASRLRCLLSVFRFLNFSETSCYQLLYIVELIHLPISPVHLLSRYQAGKEIYVQ